MVKILIITHGNLGKCLLETAELIAGKLENVHVLQKLQNESLVSTQAKVADILTKISTQDGVVILTDLLGGTPCNAAVPACRTFNVEVLTGVNLPMLLSAAFASRTSRNAAEIAQKASEEAQKSIINAKKLFINKLK
jgi:mannose/fructose/sorbose-specific phosphotransferase system IIA component